MKNYTIIDCSPQIPYTYCMLPRVFADAVNLNDPGMNPAPGLTSYGILVNVIVKNAFVFAGVISFILLILGGFQFIVAAGDTKKLEKSRGIITGSVIGLILVIASFWILEVVGVVTGQSLLNPGL